MEHPRPMLLPQQYSPVSDYTFDNHDLIQNTARQPLGESTGNGQLQGLNALSVCHQSQLALSPPIHSIPTPPVLPSQAITSTYGTSLRTRRGIHCDGSRDYPFGFPKGGGKNPIYSWKHFAAYRDKITQKEAELEDPCWPFYLEDAFLDALLLIPQMGRKKCSAKGVLYGRNMLISEYLWIYHWLVHPPAVGDDIPTGKSKELHKNFRTRKQVSSHIQVLKGYFMTHVLFHFLFPSKKESKDDDYKPSKEEEEVESFKNNRVLMALAEGRLPDERPNYEYFSRLLGADSEVFLRPKMCSVYVSSSGATLSAENTSALLSDGSCISREDFPHLGLNSHREYKDLVDSLGSPTLLLHEYTKTLSQRESTSMKEVSPRWDARFPELVEKIHAALDDAGPNDEHTARCVTGPCDILHFEVVLDMSSRKPFPTGSELNAMVQFSICHPGLYNHQWQSVTSVVKPQELQGGSPDADYWERSERVKVEITHRPSCTGDRFCDCASRGGRDTIGVQFPASSWADTLGRLAPYVAYERELEDTAKPSGKTAIKKTPRPPRGERDNKTKEQEGGKAQSKAPKKTPSPKELLQQVAMLQEIWSCPTDDSTESHKWTRRAVVMWTFAPVHDVVGDKGKITSVPAGTNWRFLTKIDPTSQYHQQRAYVDGSSAMTSKRKELVLPASGCAGSLDGALHEPFTPSTHITSPGISLPLNLSNQSSAQLTGLGFLEGFPNGLATPPPTATLGSAGYANNLDETTAPNTDSLPLQLGFIPNSSGAESCENILVGDGSDSFFASLGVPVGCYDEAEWSKLESQWPADAAAAMAFGDNQPFMGWGDGTHSSTSMLATGGDTKLKDAGWPASGTAHVTECSTTALWSTNTPPNSDETSSSQQSPPQQQYEVLWPVEDQNPPLSQAWMPMPNGGNARSWSHAASDSSRGLDRGNSVRSSANSRGSSSTSNYTMTMAAATAREAGTTPPIPKYNNGSGVSNRGLKRGRSHSSADEDRERQPLRSVRKLSHSAPTMTMDEPYVLTT